jgi:hypothetical protein
MQSQLLATMAKAVRHVGEREKAKEGDMNE